MNGAGGIKSGGGQNSNAILGIPGGGGTTPISSSIPGGGGGTAIGGDSMAG